MSELNKLRIGETSVNFPAKTFNALVDGEERDRNKPSAIDDTRQPKQKSPVVARLVWSGTDAVDPGRTLKLGNAVFEPATDEWAPFESLAFFVSEFAGSDLHQPYAIAMGPIQPGNTTPSVGYGIIPNAWWAKVNITDATHTHATPAAGTLLTSSVNGERILWKESGTGEKWAIIQVERDNFRLIRGQSYGVQSGTDVLLDNVVVLAGGFDPSEGSTSATISVANIFSQTYSDNEYVHAVYSPGVTGSSNWETLKSTAGTEQKRLLRGQTTADVLAGASTFSIDHIELLSYSIDPRSTPGSSSETLTIHKEDIKAALQDNDWITAIYNDTDGQWEWLCTERFRAIRGTWYSGTSTLVVDHLVVLDSGLDPRSDTTSDTETINVTNVASDTYGSGDKVYADWNAKDGVWEARPKGGTSGGTLKWGTINAAGSAATVAGTPSTDGTIDLYSDFGGDTGVSFNNYYPDEATSGAVGCIDSNNNIVTWSCATF